MDEQTALPRVEPLPDADLRRVLCVVAHPDDVEYGTSAAVATWTARGIGVSYLLLTHGEAGMDSVPPEEAGPLRALDQRRAAEEVGVTDLEMLHHPDGVLVYSLELRRDVARAVRRTRPDAVVLSSWEIEFVAGLNQADHRVAGLVALDGIRDAGNRWVFPELLEDGLEPWSVRWVLASGDPRPTHGVAVSPEALEAGVRSLEAHSGYLASIPGHPPARALVEGIARGAGPVLGTEAAVLFRAWDLQARPPLPGTDG